MKPLGWGVVLASLIRSPPNFTEAQIHPGPVDTTRRAQTRPHDTTRCAQGPPVIQRVAQQAVPWHKALRTCRPAPVTQRVAHKAPPMTQGVAPAPVTQGADRPPASSGAAFWQWTLRPLGWGVVLASLIRSPPNYTEAQIHPGPVDTTRRAQTRPHDTTRCAQGPPVIQRVAQQAVPWHKALRTCRPAPVTQRVAHKAPPMTQGVAPAPVTQGADRPPASSGAAFWQWTLRPLGWGVVLASLMKYFPK